MSRVAVTGAAGPVGRRVVALLLSDPSVSQVVTIDRDPVGRHHHEHASGRVVSHRIHLKGDELDPALAGVDVVCHLAGSDPLEGTATDHDLHTTTRLLDAARRAGVGHVIVRTTAAVYGAWPDNPVPLSETAPIRPNEESEWVRMRARIEDRVQAYAADPDVAATILRPCVTVSPAGPDELGRVLAVARLVAPTEGSAPIQFVHADDVASAVDVVRRRRATGVFNVAPDGSLDADMVRALVGGSPRFPLPMSVARRITAFGWRHRLAPTPPGFVPFAVHPWVVANDRLRAEGWEPEHTNEEAFVVGHAAAPWASITPQRRQELALGIAAATLVGGVAAGAAVIRRRLR